jgi:hypothetical protein
MRCGLRAGGMNVSRSLAHLSLDANGVKIAPRWKWLSWFQPAYAFDWTDVERVIEIQNVVRGPLGVRFKLVRAPRVQGGLFGPWLWRRVRRPIVWLSADRVTMVLDASPDVIARGSARSFLWWP